MVEPVAHHVQGLAHQQQAIANRLTADGLVRVATKGDVTVGYLVIVGNNATTESINTYFAYGQDPTALHNKAHEAYTSSKNPPSAAEGTVHQLRRDSAGSPFRRSSIVNISAWGG